MIKKRKTAELQDEVLLENSMSFISAKTTASHQQNSQDSPTTERSNLRSLERKRTMPFVRKEAEVKQSSGEGLLRKLLVSMSSSIKNQPSTAHKSVRIEIQEATSTMHHTEKSGFSPKYGL